MQRSMLTTTALLAVFGALVLAGCARRIRARRSASTAQRLATLKGLNGIRLGMVSADSTWLIDSGYGLDGRP